MYIPHYNSIGIHITYYIILKKLVYFIWLLISTQIHNRLFIRSTIIVYIILKRISIIYWPIKMRNIVPYSEINLD